MDIEGKRRISLLDVKIVKMCNWIMIAYYICINQITVINFHVYLPANSAKTQFRITRWNSNLTARSLLSSNGNIWAQNASNLLENPPFESVFSHLVNFGRIISVSGLYMNQNTLELMQLFCRVEQI